MQVCNAQCWCSFPRSVSINYVLRTSPKINFHYSRPNLVTGLFLKRRLGNFCIFDELKFSIKTLIRLLFSIDGFERLEQSKSRSFYHQE